MVALAALVFVTSVAAVVTLQLNGRDTTAVLGLVTPVVTALLVGYHLSSTQTETAKIQSRKLDQTNLALNGTLDTRIEQAVTRALARNTTTNEAHNDEHQALNDE